MGGEYALLPQESDPESSFCHFLCGQIIFKSYLQALKDRRGRGPSWNLDGL